MFSAPILIFVPLVASIAGTKSIAGTQNTTSTSSLATNGFNSLINATASLGVLFIFQLPAIIFFLIMKSPLYLRHFLLTFYVNKNAGNVITYHSFAVFLLMQSINKHAGIRQLHKNKSLNK